jgi:hypothetical protein
VPAGDVGGACRVSRGVEQGAQSREGSYDVVSGHSDVESGAEDVEKEADVALRYFGYVRGVAVDGFVGEPDVDPAVALRQDEDEAVGLPGDRDVHADSEAPEVLGAQD